MIFNIVFLLIGLMILGFGIYYLINSKEDAESKKIYTIASVIGGLITVFVIVKMILF